MFATDTFIDDSLRNEKVLKYEYVKNYIINNKPKKVLEIGCGAGTIVRTLVMDFPDIEFFGFDVDKKALDYAGDSNNYVQHKNIKYIYDYQTVLDGIKPDLIILIDVLEHVSTPNLFLSELNKYNLLIHIPLEASGIYKFKYFLNIKSLYSEHERFYDFCSLNKMLDANGFRIKEKWFHYHLISGFRDFLKYYLLYKNKMPVDNKNSFYTKNWQSLYRYAKIPLRVLDFLSYYESKLLKNIKFFSSGVTLVAIPT